MQWDIWDCTGPAKQHGSWERLAAFRILRWDTLGTLKCRWVPTLQWLNPSPSQHGWWHLETQILQVDYFLSCSDKWHLEPFEMPKAIWPGFHLPCAEGASLFGHLESRPFHLHWLKYLWSETWTKSLTHLWHLHGDTCIQVSKFVHLNSQKKLCLSDTIWFWISFTFCFSWSHTKPLYSKKQTWKKMSK